VGRPDFGDAHRSGFGAVAAPGLEAGDAVVGHEHQHIAERGEERLRALPVVVEVDA
jgi:hypothetical protein